MKDKIYGLYLNYKKQNKTIETNEVKPQTSYRINNKRDFKMLMMRFITILIKRS